MSPLRARWRHGRDLCAGGVSDTGGCSCLIGLVTGVSFLICFALGCQYDTSGPWPTSWNVIGAIAIIGMIGGLMLWFFNTYICDVSTLLFSRKDL